MAKKKNLLSKRSKGIRTLTAVHRLLADEVNRINNEQQGQVQPGDVMAAAVLGFLGLPEETRGKLARMASVCTHCGNGNPLDARFCRRCGKRLLRSGGSLAYRFGAGLRRGRVGPWLLILGTAYALIVLVGKAITYR